MFIFARIRYISFVYVFELVFFSFHFNRNGSTFPIGDPSDTTYKTFISHLQYIIIPFCILCISMLCSIVYLVYVFKRSRSRKMEGKKIFPCFINCSYLDILRAILAFHFLNTLYLILYLYTHF